MGDRVAERRYHYALGQNDIAKSQGKPGFPNCSPQMEVCTFELTSEMKSGLSKFLTGMEGADEILKQGDIVKLTVPKSVKLTVDKEFEKGLEELKGGLMAEGKTATWWDTEGEKETIAAMSKTLVDQWMAATAE